MYTTLFVPKTLYFRTKHSFMTPFLVSSYFATHPITRLLKILGGRMHGPSPSSNLHIWLQHTHAHPYTQTHTHTPQSMSTHQGFRVESWSLTYRCYICRSLGLVVERPQCASFFAEPRLLHATLRPHECKGVQIQTLLLPVVASLDKEYA